VEGLQDPLNGSGVKRCGDQTKKTNGGEAAKERYFAKLLL